MNGGRVVGAYVDHDLCAGVSMCMQFAPEGFALDDDGQAVFLPDGTWDVEELAEAADSCPMAAITLREGSR